MSIGSWCSSMIIRFYTLPVISAEVLFLWFISTLMKLILYEILFRESANKHLLSGAPWQVHVSHAVWHHYSARCTPSEQPGCQWPILGVPPDAVARRGSAGEMWKKPSRRPTQDKTSWVGRSCVRIPVVATLFTLKSQLKTTSSISRI